MKLVGDTPPFTLMTVMQSLLLPWAEGRPPNLVNLNLDEPMKTSIGELTDLSTVRICELSKDVMCMALEAYNAYQRMCAWLWKPIVYSSKMQSSSLRDRSKFDSFSTMYFTSSYTQPRRSPAYHPMKKPSTAAVTVSARLFKIIFYLQMTRNVNT